MEAMRLTINPPLAFGLGEGGQNPYTPQLLVHPADLIVLPYMGLSGFEHLVWQRMFQLGSSRADGRQEQPIVHKKEGGTIMMS